MKLQSLVMTGFLALCTLAVPLASAIAQDDLVLVYEEKVLVAGRITDVDQELEWSKEKKRRRRVKTAQMIDACSKYLGEDPLELPPRWDRLPVLEGISLMRVALRRAGLLQEA